jgi:hypothetical protein
LVSRRARGQSRPNLDGDSATSGQALWTKLTGLIQEHRDLDGVILLLFQAGACDPLLMARLKKRKLHLKDEIARLSESCEAALVSC